MKHKFLSLSILCLALGSVPVDAALLYWSGNGTAFGGPGTWNTTSGHWGTDTVGPFTTLWSNTVTNDATVDNGNGAGGSIVIGSAITMNGTLTLNGSGGTYPAYTINGTSIMTFNLGSAINVPTGFYRNFNSPYAGTITKTGAGTVNFNNSNGNVTKFILQAGLANFSAGNRFGTGADRSDFLTLDGGAMRGDLTAWGSFGKSISLTANGGTITGSASTVVMTADQPITSTGTGRLTVGCQLTLSNTTNSWTGPMTISTGAKVTLGKANVIPDGCVVTCTGTLNLANFSETISTLSGAGSVTLGSGTLTLASGRNTFSGPISGTGGLVQNSTSFETLSGANTYTGPTTINSGALVFSGASTCTGVTTVNSGGTLRIATSGTAFPSSPIVLAAGGTLDVTGLSATIAALSGSGIVSNNVGQTLTVNGDLTTAGTTSGTGFQVYSCYSGALTNGSLYKSGTHAMALRGSNTFEGTLTFDNGTLSVGAAPNRLPPTLALGFNSPALFQLDANSQSFAALSGTGSLNLGGGNLTVNETGSGTFSGVIQDSELANSPTAVGHGLRGYYYDNIDLTNLKAVRDDANINFTDLTSSNQLPVAIYSGASGTNTVSIRWLGQLLTTAAGTYTFTTTCDDGRRLWINGQLVVDSWVSGATTKTGTVALAASSRYDLVMEFFNGSGGSSAKLLWTPPGDTVAVIIPTDYLFLPGPGALVMNGTGTLNLTSPSSYSGDTIVAAGTLGAQVDGSLGNGNVTVSNANLTLYTGSTMSTNANLLLNGASPVVNLGYAGTEVVHGLSYDGGTNYQPAGTYGAPLSGATYTDPRFGGAGILNVVGVPTTTILASSGSPSAVYGSPITLTATVTPLGVTGNVAFYDGANLLGSAAVNGAGVATWSVSNLQVVGSPHALTAVYRGDDTHAPSTSAAVSQSTTVATLIPNVVVANKAYDGTTNATISTATTFTGIYSGDTNYIHIDGAAVAGFDDQYVGTNKTVNITGMTLAGSLVSNYVMPTTAASVTANITAKALTVTNLTASNKVYDGGINATVTGTPGLSGILGTDVVTLGGTPVATFDTKNIGTNKTVTVNGYTLGGANSTNYSVTTPSLKANISTSPISVGGLSVVTKIYDGTNSATLTGTAVLSPAPFGGDVVTLGGTVIASFNNKNAGTGKAVTVTGYTVSGTDGTNYSLSQPAGLTGTITTVPTSCVLLSSVNPSTNGQSVTFTATITSSPLPVVNDAPASTVSFAVGGIAQATPTVVSNAPGVSTAVWTTTTLALGTNTVLAAYITDGNYQASNNSVQQVVANPSTASAVTISNIVNTTLTYGGGSGAKFILVKSADASAPMIAWTYPRQTNLSTPGSFTIPAVGTGSPVFYRVLSQ